MDQYVGLDVSQKGTSVCVIDVNGRRPWEASCPSKPKAIAGILRAKVPNAKRIAMETGLGVCYERDPVAFPLVRVSTTRLEDV